MKNISRGRKLRYGTVSLVLCILAVSCVVIVNVIAGVLSLRYDWMYLKMTHPAVYDISDSCRDYIAEYVIPEVDKKRASGDSDASLRVIFCDGGTENASEDKYRYVYESFAELSEMFEGYIETEHLNIFERPMLAREYGVSSSEDIVCIFDGKSETVNINDFYIIETVNDQSTITAYNGEKMIASCFMRVTQGETPICYLTVNHSEAYSDFEFARMISEAGYDVKALDLYTEEIPEDCDLLVTFDPKKDLAAFDETSDTSEIEKLDRYMSEGGKYMVFVSSSTFSSGAFENLEGFLADWGVRYRHETTEEGVEACRIVRDSANSLTVDGYTVLASAAQNGVASGLKGATELQNAFGNTTYMSVSEGFSSHGPSYISEDVKRVMSPLFLARPTAVAWADGKAVARASDEEMMLMSVCEQYCENGETSYLLASASVDFASESVMQSSVLGNSRTLTDILRYMGKENAPSSIVFKPFGETDIQSLTSNTANMITAVLVVLPALVVSTVGAILLLRRRNR